MLTRAQYTRLRSVQDQPWLGMLNYFRTLQAEWDALEAQEVCDQASGIRFLPGNRGLGIHHHRSRAGSTH